MPRVPRIPKKIPKSVKPMKSVRKEMLSHADANSPTIRWNEKRSGDSGAFGMSGIRSRVP